MAITVRELVTKWGFKVNTKPIDDMDRRIKASKKLAKQTAIAITGISAAVGLLLFQAGKFEQWRIAFETMLGSADRAKKLLDEIKQFTLETPFQLPQVVEGAKRLLAFGIEAEKIIPTLKMLGDVSAGLGTDLGRMILNFGQVRTQAKLTGRELRDFAILGVPLIENLAKVLNVADKEVQDLVSRGEISFEIVEQAFKNMTGAGGKFADLMKKQMAALFGILSNVRDMFIQIAIVLGDKILPEAKRVAKEFLNFLLINKKLIELELGKVLEDALKFVQRILKLIVIIAKALNRVLKIVGGLTNAFKLLLIVFFGFIAINIVGLIGAITLALGVLIAGIKVLGNQALIAQAKLLLIPLAIGAGVIALGLIIDDLIAFVKGDQSLFGVLIDIIENRLPKALRALINPFSPIIDFFNNAAKISAGFSKIGGVLAAPVAPILSGVGGNQINISSPIAISVPEGTPTNEVAKEVKVGVIESLTNIFKTTFDSIEDRGK